MSQINIRGVDWTLVSQVRLVCDCGEPFDLYKVSTKNRSDYKWMLGHVEACRDGVLRPLLTGYSPHGVIELLIQIRQTSHSLMEYYEKQQRGPTDAEYLS